MAEIFDFDEFFVAEEDPGVEVNVPMNGREVPIRIKRGVSTGDFKSAQAKAVKQVMGPKGDLQIKGMDEEIFSAELLTSCIKSWPFTRSKKDRHGNIVREPVPVTKENVRALLAEGAGYLQNYITGQIVKAKVEVSPLESPSGEGS